MRKRDFHLLQQVDFRCKACGADLRYTKWEIDHIHPRSRGGGDQSINLQILCRECNRSKSAKLMAQWAPWLLREDGRVIHKWDELRKPGEVVEPVVERKHSKYGHRRKNLTGFRPTPRLIPPR